MPDLTPEELQQKELEIAKKEQELAEKEKELLEKLKNPDLDKLAQQKTEEAIKEIKGKLDSAYAKRDEALRKIAEFEQKEKEAELKRLQEEGKHKEAYEIQLAEERAKREAAEKRNIELTRDLEIRNSLSKHPFRNEMATEMAFNQIVTQVIQDANGNWIHKSGVAIKDYIKAFAEMEDNSFLFKAKANSGSGGSSASGSSSGSEPKSIFDLSQEEVLKRAAAGTLRK